MSFPSKASSSLPPGLKLGVFAGGGPFPRLVAPGIVVGDRDLSSHLQPQPQPQSQTQLGPGAGSFYAQQLGLTHVLTRADSAHLAYQTLSPPHQDESTSTSTGSVLNVNANMNTNVLVMGERQTLRETVELLVRVRVACPCGRILLLGGEPFVAAAYLMAIEGRDLQASWRLVTGETLEPGVFKEVHRVLGAFARDVEEEGRRLARAEEEEEEARKRQRQRRESQHPLQPPRKRGRNHKEWRLETHDDLFPPCHRPNVISHPQ